MAFLTGDLELTQPVSRAQLVLGKVAATSVFSAASLALFLASLALSLPYAPLHKVGMSLHIGVSTALLVFFVALPLILFAAALLNVVASFAKSYKEAQTYLTFVILIPTLPLIITRLMNVESSAALMLMPRTGKKIIAVRKLKGIAMLVSAALRKPIVNHRMAITSTMPSSRFSTRVRIWGATNAAVSRAL